MDRRRFVVRAAAFRPLRPAPVALPLLTVLLAAMTSLVAQAQSGVFQVSFYAAASNDRINAPTSSTENEKTTTGPALGLSMELVPWRGPAAKHPNGNLEVRLYGTALLSRRTFQVDSVTGSVPESQSAATRLTDADAGEFYLGSRLMWCYGAPSGPTKNGWSSRPYSIYVRGEYGGISSQDSIGDLLDTTFIGAGVQYSGFPFVGSYIEYGFGETDLFLPDHRSGRQKFRMAIEYALTSRDSMSSSDLYPTSSVFVHVRVDSDRRNDAADGVRVLFGVRLDAMETLSSILGLLGVKTHGG